MIAGENGVGHGVLCELVMITALLISQIQCLKVIRVYAISNEPFMVHMYVVVVIYWCSWMPVVIPYPMMS